MNSEQKKNRPTPSKEIAYIAIMVALLIGGQQVFALIVGVEIVTLLLVCFSSVFGVKRGIICAVAFSLLRNLFVEFSATALILYLVYFPLLAAIFGGLGHIKESTFKNFPIWFTFIINILLLGIAAACACCYFLNLIKLSRFVKAAMYALLLVIFSICIAMCIAFDVLFIMKKVFSKNTEDILKLITFASIAAMCTIMFTLLDDAIVLTLIYKGSDAKTDLTYFYSSFTAMLPQTVCTIVTVGTLFLPLTAAIRSAVKI